MDALGQLINRNGKFTRPRSSIAALEEWRLENNHLADFVAEQLYEDPQASLGVQVAYDAYVSWFASTWLRGMLGRKQFSKRLATLLRMPNKRTTEGYTFQGVARR